MCQCLVCGKIFECDEGDGTHWDRRAECCDKKGKLTIAFKNTDIENFELENDEIAYIVVDKRDGHRELYFKQVEGDMGDEEAEEN